LKSTFGMAVPSVVLARLVSGASRRPKLTLRNVGFATDAI